MNILVITKAAWDDRIASGNTLSNFFEGWEGVNFSCLYSRDAEPNNNVCKEYYSISPISIIKHFFNPSEIGRRFIYEFQNGHSIDSTNEVKMISTAKRFLNLSIIWRMLLIRGKMDPSRNSLQIVTLI